jgi:hypothetical protein
MSAKLFKIDFLHLSITSKITPKIKVDTPQDSVYILYNNH